jgi:hypothetical protein
LKARKPENIAFVVCVGSGLYGRLPRYGLEGHHVAAAGKRAERLAESVSGRSQVGLKVAVGLLCALLVLAAGHARADELTVTKTTDSGFDSLRQVILDANATEEADRITVEVGETWTDSSGLGSTTDHGSLTYGFRRWCATIRTQSGQSSTRATPYAPGRPTSPG